MHRVILWQDGKVYVFNSGNTHLKVYEGMYSIVKERIFLNASPDTLFVLANSKERNVKIVTKEEWMEAESHILF